MNSLELKNQIINDSLDDLFVALYGAKNVDLQKMRYAEAVDAFVALYGERDNLHIFSAPGRTEIGGNHTDHNLGKVLAGSVNLDIIAIVSKNDIHEIKIQSKGFKMDRVDIRSLAPVEAEVNKSAALIRGIAARTEELGYKIGGFDAYTVSDVLKGSGLSSSAAFEVLVGVILNHSYNGGDIAAVEIAKIAQYAENVYFKKPCGLMDQMASSVGGIISIDFEKPEIPIIRKIDFDFAKSGYALCIVDTGGNHADLTAEYAAIPKEMKQVAGFFGAPALRSVQKEQILESLAPLREKFGDRAVLRTLHFLDDSERVETEISALTSKNFEEFKRLITQSGNSSYKYLQNVYASINVREQGLSLALYLAENILCDRGAYRVHGGGFGGTTQNFVPLDLLEEFVSQIEKVFGEGSCHVLMIRPCGGIKIL